MGRYLDRSCLLQVFELLLSRGADPKVWVEKDLYANVLIETVFPDDAAWLLSKSPTQSSSLATPIETSDSETLYYWMQRKLLIS